MINFIKSLFCKHNFIHIRNIYGDQIHVYDGKRSIFKCKKCGKYQAMDELV